MPRARNIKPAFFTNDKLAECQPLARILFIGLWTIADREGRLEDRPKKIKAETLPYDNCDADLLLTELHNGGFITRYSIENIAYIQVINFTKHQNCHMKESVSTIPAPDKHGANTILVSEIPALARPLTESLLLKPETPLLKPESKKKGDTFVLPLPDWMPIQDWDDYLEMRNNKGKGKATNRAKQLVIIKLDELRNKGQPPDKVLQQSIVNGWTSVFELKDYKNGNTKRKHSGFNEQDWTAGTEGFDTSGRTF